MNKYQKVICQIAKDSMNEPVALKFGLSFRTVRNSIRHLFKGKSFEYLNNFRKYNEALKVRG